MAAAGTIDERIGQHGLLKLSLAMCVALTLLAAPALCQDSTQTDEPPAAEHQRILWIIPNYRTSPTLTDYQALTPKQKFAVATRDALDPGTFVLAALFAAQGQLSASSPSFGEGVGAYPKYYAASLTDWVVGDFMTEAVFPVMLRQDPRYFRRGTGSGLSRLGYAMGQIFWTHVDSGGMQVNVSELAGNATAVAIGNAYYPDNRTLSGNVSKLSIQIGVDLVSNILKEFSPDLDRLLTRGHQSERIRHERQPPR